MGGLKLFLLGSPYLEREGATIVVQRRKVLALLTYLAVEKKAQRRDTLMDLFWPNSSTKLARGSLRRTLSELRQVVGGDWVSSDREMVSLNPGQDLWLDVARFKKCLADCSQATPANLDSMNQALKLYRGDFMSGFTLPDCPDFDEWQFFQGEGLRQTLATALEYLSNLHSQRGEYDQAISHTRRWLSLDSLHEPAQRRLMLLYAQAGQLSAALRQYQLCVDALETELGVPPSDATIALYERIRAREHARGKDLAASSPSPQFVRSLGLEQAPVAHNLPPQPTSFIGREDDLAQILRLLGDEPDCRLLTLIGPGGAGKTRLALRAAERALHSFAGGVYFVSLVGVSDPEFLVSTIAETLDISLSSQADPREQLLNHLRQKEMLLVLDNLEQLLGGVDLLSDIVLTAPQVKLLVTSRARLNLQEEWGLEVKGMRYPLSAAAAGPGLQTYSAVQLFVERARRVKVDFELREKDIPAMLQICQLVDGMPLGIELAVFWLRMMPCQEIARQIEQSLDFLITSVHNVPERHHSLRAVFEHSWLLLSEDERAVLGQLSVFRGGFHSRAARRVAGAALPLLSALVDKSLVQRDRSGRYKIHELLRQFAAEKLQEHSEQVRDRHCTYYSSFLQAREPHLKGSGQKETLQPIMVEIDNIRAAWYWAIEQGHAETAGKFVTSFELISDMQGRFHDTIKVFDKAIAKLEAQLDAGGQSQSAHSKQITLLLGRILSTQGQFYNRLGWLERAKTLCYASLTYLDRLEPGQEQAWACANARRCLGQTLHQQGNFAESVPLYQQALAYFEACGDQYKRASIMGSLGMNAFHLGQYAEAERLLQQSVALCVDIGEERGKAFLLHTLGYFVYAQARGDYQQAEKLVQESLEISQELDDRVGTGFALMHLGAVAAGVKRYARARQLYQESLTIARETDTRTMKLGSLDGLGAVALAVGEYEQARQWYQESVAVSDLVGQGKQAPVALMGLGNVACALEEHAQAARCFVQALQTPVRSVGETLDVVVGVAQLLGQIEEREQAVELLALVLHHPASLPLTRDRATQLLSEMDALLPPDVLAAAKERGQALDLEATVTKLSLQLGG